jgi:hypothetical protein
MRQGLHLAAGLHSVRSVGAQDPDASDEDALALLSRQFACLGDALRDAAPSVRAAACSGVCGLLNTYWEIIPAPLIAGYLQHIGGAGPGPVVPCGMQITLPDEAPDPSAFPLPPVLLFFHASTMREGPHPMQGHEIV